MLACGNPSRGDDALGPTLLERLGRDQAEGALTGCDLVTDFQLQVEHALDLIGRRLLIVVDASVRAEAPYAFTPVRPEPGPSHSTHVVTPGELLHTYARITPQMQIQTGLPTRPGPCPEAWLLAIRGYRFELGDGLSSAAAANLDAAYAFLVGHLRDYVAAAEDAARPARSPALGTGR